MQCQGTTQGGEQCTREAEEGREYCYQHPAGDGPQQVSTERMMAAVAKTQGRIAAAAKLIDISHRQIRRRMSQSEELRQAVEAHRKRQVERADSQLQRAIADGEAWAIRFKLTHDPESRYSERTASGSSSDAGGDYPGITKEDGETVVEVDFPDGATGR